MYDAVVKQFTFAVSSPDEFLVLTLHLAVTQMHIAHLLFILTDSQCNRTATTTNATVVFVWVMGWGGYAARILAVSKVGPLFTFQNKKNEYISAFRIFNSKVHAVWAKLKAAFQKQFSLYNYGENCF